MFIIKNEFSNLILKYPYDDSWKSNMINYNNYIYSEFSKNYQMYFEYDVNISSYFIFIYKSLKNKYKFYNSLKTHIKLLSKKLIKYLYTDEFIFDDSLYDNICVEIDNSYNKFLDVLEVNDDIEISDYYCNIDHMIMGHIIGSFLNISPILCLFLNPYIYTKRYYIITRLIYFKFSRVHYIMSESFGYLKVKYNLGPGYTYLMIGDENDEKRKDKNISLTYNFYIKYFKKQ